MWSDSYPSGSLDRLLSDRWRLVLASVFAVVFLGLAGILGYRALTIDENDVWCTSKTPYGILTFAGIVVGIAGLVLLVANVRRLRRPWPSVRLVSAMCGLAMFGCGAAAVLLSARANSWLDGCEL